VNWRIGGNLEEIDGLLRLHQTIRSSPIDDPLKMLTKTFPNLNRNFTSIASPRRIYSGQSLDGAALGLRGLLLCVDRLPAFD
jgi:hypothetical protein